MNKKNVFPKSPEFKHEVKTLKNRSKKSIIPDIECNWTENGEILDVPIKSAKDKKLYKTLRLNNGLTVLLISEQSRPDKDSESLHAACSLSVNVGSYSDPPDIQGLAHFVEHMLFMGSEKYPQENEFHAFIKDNDGNDNASTDCEVTNFYFELLEKQLPKAMDIFSQFFISPLMTKDAMQREREAIDAEFADASSADVNRKIELLSSLFPKGHPARTFTWGNLKSLRDDINDDEKLHKAAHEFRRRHYSANRMTLAVQAHMDLVSLEQHVVDTFGQIPTNNLPPDDFSQYAFRPDTAMPEFRSMYYIKTISDSLELHLTWCMPSLISQYESKPHKYVSHILGHEGKGSLLYYLKKKAWALKLSTGSRKNGIDSTSTHSLFLTRVLLTNEGFIHMEEVIEAIFSFINMLRKLGPSERIYDKLKKLEQTNFLFDEESRPVHNVMKLADNMHLYPPEHYITGRRLYYEYNTKSIMDFLECMRPDKTNIMIFTNSESIHYDAKEKWFGTQYKKQEIPQNWLQRWMKVEPYPEFRPPEENVYIATNFDLIPPAQPYLDMAKKLGINLTNTTAIDIHRKVAASEPTLVVLKQKDLIATVNNFRLDQPNLLRKNRHMELWYKPDFKFRLPIALLYFYFITPLIVQSPRDACILDLWINYLRLDLRVETYPASLANLGHSLRVSEKGLMLKVHGYNENIHLLVEKISRYLNATRDSGMDASLFEAVREERARFYHSDLIDEDILANQIFKTILLEPYITLWDKASVIHNITLDELQQFSNKVLSKLYLQVLVQGNLAWHDAIRISNSVLANIEWDGFSEDELPKRLVHELPLGERKLRVRNLNPHSTTSVVINYYQGEASTAKDADILQALMRTMQEPLFDTLRTKEQLGYQVSCRKQSTFGVLGFSINVNTHIDKFSVSHVNNRVEAFLGNFTRDLSEANDSIIIYLKQGADYDIVNEMDKNWKQITSREYQFQERYKEKEVKLSDIYHWVKKHFSTGNKTHFRKLSIQVVGHKVSKDNTAVTDNQPIDYSLTYMDASESIGDTIEHNKDFIKNINEFKKTMPIIEVPKVKIAQF